MQLADRASKRPQTHALCLACCRASPEVAAYPFTTLRPNLGTLMVGGQSTQQPRPVLADLPGLIAGAHQVSKVVDAKLRSVQAQPQLKNILSGADIAWKG